MLTSLTKHEVKKCTAELRELINDWNPIGFTCPPDEYDCLLGPLLTLLRSSAGEMEIAAFLKKEIVGHFGLPPEEYDFLAMAKRVHTWFETYWSKPGELTTIYVALLDEGVDVWRPVQARMIGSDRYRILGIDADVSDEKWQFPPGAVVRCEPKRFSSGEVGTIAVARVDTAG